MSARQINFTEAIELCKADDADFYPFATINDVGIENLRQFVNSYAKKPDRHDISAWAREAESVASNLLGGYAAIIEMGGFYTSDKNPATINMESADFNWFVNE